MTNRKSRLALIHVAKKQLDLDDDAYRAILSGAGVDSAADITEDAQYNDIMLAFTNMGFVSSGHNRSVKFGKSVPAKNKYYISARQAYYIRGLWDLASRANNERSLRAIVRRIGKVDDIRFLTRRAASAVILALRDICWKAGFNPDSKESISR